MNTPINQLVFHVQLAAALIRELRSRDVQLSTRETVALLRLSRIGAPFAGYKTWRRLALRVLAIRASVANTADFDTALVEALRTIVPVDQQLVTGPPIPQTNPKTSVPLKQTAPATPPVIPYEQLSAPPGEIGPSYTPVTPQTPMPAQRTSERVLEITLTAPSAAPSLIPVTPPQSSDEYYPLTRRDLIQAWRLLANRAPLGSRDELDMQATIDRLARQGGLDAPVIRRRRKNRTALLLLIDCSRSMGPFRELSDRLSVTARHNGNFAAVQTLYFANFPNRLYADISQSSSVAAEAAIASLRFNAGLRNNVAVLIFSDGGAARRHFNPGRVWITNETLRALRKQQVSLAWLNPLPDERWQGSTAADIDAELAPMFSFSKNGFLGAIDTLKGHSAASRGSR